MLACAITLLTAKVSSATPTEDFPHASLTFNGVTGQAELHILGDDAVLTFRAPDGTVTPLRAIDTPDDTLAVLADPRLTFAEPALLNWAGKDLGIQRNRMLARAKAAVQMSLPTLMPQSDAERWSGTAELAATLQYVRVLTETGKSDEAVAYLRNRLGQLPPGEPPSDDHTRLAIRLANILFTQGHGEEAVALLEAESTALPIQSDSHVNLDINLAALAARTGHYQRALALVDIVWRSSSGSDPDKVLEGTIIVPGSEAQFAWIRACALNGLGQKDKAQKIMAAVSNVPAERPGAASSTAGARQRGFLCMKDADGLARELADELSKAPPAGDILLYLDPLNEQRDDSRVILRAALAKPVLARAMVGRVRPLTRFAVAVSHWTQEETSPPG